MVGKKGNTKLSEIMKMEKTTEKNGNRKNGQQKIGQLEFSGCRFFRCRFFSCCFFPLPFLHFTNDTRVIIL